MDYETAQKLENGEMPGEWYSTANTQSDLSALIERLGSGATIRADAPRGQGLSFGTTASGRRVFATDEFLDDEEETPNPDFREERFDTAAQGVASFKINGKPLIDAVRGRRIAQADAPNTYAD